MVLFNDFSAPGVSRAEAVESGDLPWGRVKQDGGEPSPRVAGLMPEGSAGSAHHSSWKTERVCGQGEPQAGRWVNFGRKSCSLSWGTDFTGGEGSWVPQEEGEEKFLEEGGQTDSPSPEIRNVDRVSPQVLC